MYAQLIDRFVEWARTDPDIRSALIIGSRARTDHPADEWSDLDILLVATDPRRYLETDDWVHALGSPWVTFVESTGDGRGLERRVLFEGGLDVDFAMLPLALFQQMADGGLPPDAAETLLRGMRILLDKDDLAAKLRLELKPSVPRPPTEEEYLAVVNDFWYHAVWSAKHLRRGELWWAKSGCDNHLKGLLRQMLEWQARARKGQSYDTWLRGRFLEEWADPRAVAKLPEAFAHYDEADVWRALFVTMDLFRWLAVETAELSRYSYPANGDERSTEFVRAVFRNAESVRSADGTR